MKRRLTIFPALAALLALVVLPALLAPVALADHVYSHRAVVVGRVVGADGVPVAGAPVSVAFENVTVGGKCFDSRDETTGPQGDFVVCRHAHVLPEAGVHVDVTVLGNTTRAIFDTTLRRAAVLVQLDGPTPREHRDIGGQRAFDRSVLVTGRLFELGSAQVENVNVTGTPLSGDLVMVRLETSEGVLIAEGNDTTDGSGDYSILIEAGELPEGARVHVATAYGTRDEPLDLTFRRANVDVVHEPFVFAPDVERPGSSPGRAPVPGAPAMFVVLAIAAVALGSRGAALGPAALFGRLSRRR